MSTPVRRLTALPVPEPAPRTGAIPRSGVLRLDSPDEVLPGRPRHGADVVDARASLQALLLSERAAVVVGLSLTFSYLFLRSIDAGRPAMIGWAAMMAILSLLWPAGGLIGLLAIAPFTEPFALTPEIGAKPLLILPILAGAVLRFIGGVVRSRRLPRPRPVVVAAFLLLAATAISILTAAQTLGVEFALRGAGLWLVGIGGGLLIFLVAYQSGRAGSLWPIGVALGAASLAGVVSLIDYLDSTLVRSGPLDWMLRRYFEDTRLMGVIPSANGVAALVVIPTAAFLVGAVLAPRRLWKIGFALLAVPLLVTLYLTYSRAPFLAYFAVAIALTWRFRWWLGIMMLAVGLAVGATLLPAYIQARADVGGGAAVQENRLLVETDALRFRGWRASGRMFRDSPLLGQGFQTYRELHDEFGDRAQRAPHNEWLRFFAEGGILAGGSAIAFVLAVLAGLARARTRIAFAALAAFGAWIIAATFNNPLLFMQINAILFAVIGAAVALPATRAIGRPAGTSTAGLLPGIPWGPLERQPSPEITASGGESPATAPTVIRPPDRWPDLGLGEEWRYRAICLVLAKRNLKVRYRQTLIGAGWAIVQPIMLMLVFTVFFGLLARLPSQGVPYPVFFLTGLAIWYVTAKVLTEGSMSVVANAHLVNRVYFPRIYFPVAVALASLVDLTFNGLSLALFLAAFGFVPGPWVVLVPVFVAITYAASLGAAFWLSAINVAYRDVAVILGFLSQLWFFTTPIIYPASIVPEPYQALYFLNPMALVVTGLRWTLLGTPAPPLVAWPLGISVALLVLVTGYVFYRQRERTFADVI